MSRSPLRSLPALLALALLALFTLAPGSLAASHDTDATLSAPQAVIDLTAVADTAVLSWAPDSNFGSVNILQFTYGGPDLPIEARTLVRFDLTGLPAGTVIDSAVMELWQEDPAQSPSVTAAVYQAGQRLG